MAQKSNLSILFHHAVWPLAVGQTLIWASLFYSFSALFLAWERDLGWSKTELSGAFTLAVLVSAFLAPLTGRIVDRGYGTALLTSAPLLGAFCLVMLSQVTTVWQFYAVYIVIGISMSGGLYESCFALLTRTLGWQARMGITRVSLLAGLAGTISFPGNTYLEGLIGWRMTMWVLAGILVFIVAPLHRYGATYAYRQAAENEQAVEEPAATQKREKSDNAEDNSSDQGGGIVRNPAFWLLGLSFSMIGLNHSAIITHMLPLFDERAIPEGMAVLAASMIGPMQVVGRLIMLSLERRFSSLLLFIGCFGFMAIGSLSLLGANIMPWLVIIFVFFQGAGAGTTSILRPVMTADLLGSENFGVISGLLAVPARVAAAVASTVAALIWGVGGYNLVLWFTLSFALIGLISLIFASSVNGSSVEMPEVR